MASCRNQDVGLCSSGAKAIRDKCAAKRYALVVTFLSTNNIKMVGLPN